MNNMIRKFDDNGNCIYTKSDSGREEWFEYDEKGRLKSKHTSDNETYFYIPLDMILESINNNR